MKVSRGWGKAGEARGRPGLEWLITIQYFHWCLPHPAGPGWWGHTRTTTHDSSSYQLFIQNCYHSITNQFIFRELSYLASQHILPTAFHHFIQTLAKLKCTKGRHPPSSYKRLAGLPWPPGHWYNNLPLPIPLTSGRCYLRQVTPTKYTWTFKQ